MNGTATRKPYGYDGGRQSPAQQRSGGGGGGGNNGVGLVGGKTLVEGYRKDILSGFEQDKPLYNPVRQKLPQMAH